MGAPSPQRATTVRRPAAIDAGGARGGVVVGGVLGAVPAVAPSGPESAPGVADPVAPDAIAPVFLLFVLAAQVIVAAAWLPFARRMLGGFGTRRLG